MNEMRPAESRNIRGRRDNKFSLGMASAKGDIAKLFIVLFNGRFLVLIFVLAGMLLGLAYVVVTPKTYSASTQVVIDTREQNPTEGGQVMSNMQVNSSVVAGEVVAIQSNVLLSRVVDKLNLSEVPDFRPKRADVAEAMTPEARRKYATAVLERNLSVRQLGISFAILISYTSSDPQVAANVANEVALQYIRDQISLKRDATLQATGFLEARITELAKQVEVAEDKVVEYQRSLLTRLGADQTAIEQLLSDLNAEYASVSAELTDVTARYDTARRLLDEGGITAVRDILSSPLLEKLTADYATVASERARLGTTLGELHPDFLRIGAQLEDLERSIKQELNKQLETMKREVDVVADRENALKSRIEELQYRQAEFRQASVRLGQLQRAADAERLVYQNFLERFTEMSAQADYQASEARLVGLATAPGWPIWPKIPLILALSMMAGFSVGTAMVLWRAAYLRPITSASDLEDITGLPVLAALPYVGEFSLPLRFPFRRKQEMQITMDRFSERVRSLRAKLFLQDGGVSNRVLLVTSALPSEGKTTTAYALVNSLHRIKRNVVLLDADLRRSNSRSKLGLTDESSCLVDYLERDDVPTNALIQTSNTFGIKVVAPMRRTNEASDLLIRESLDRLVEFLSSKFEYVIIDCPPVISLADTQSVAAHASSAILVVKNSSTRESLVLSALQELFDSGVGCAGTVLTQVRRAESRSDELYGYYYE